MKRIVVLIIASLLVLGVVLPGCVEAHIIKIAVCGPMADIQGKHHWWGAEMARDEINDAGGVDVDGTMYDIELVKVGTNETLNPSGADGITALTAVIDDVDFVVGGFRTEAVAVYREVAMDAEVIFMNCGAATGALQFSVVTNYADYKYWFKATPYNESFLVTSLLKMTGTIGAVLKATLQYLESADPAYVQGAYKMSNAVGGKPRVEILMEDAAWCAGMVPAAQYYLPLQGFNVTGTTLVSPTAPAIGPELAAIAANNPHIILTAFSGSVGDVYSRGKNIPGGIPALTIGINVAGQSKSHWTGTGGACEGEIMLDTWAEGMEQTPNTLEWFNAFVDKVGDYPLHTAATYDAIYALKTAIEATDSLNADDLILYLETHSYTSVGATTAYYPMPAIEITPGSLYALNETQVRDLYDLDDYGWAYNQTQWLCAPSASNGPHIAHDLLYGPGYDTGIGSQWRDGHKVGVWPMDLGAPYDGPLTDQYGCWNFEYPGTQPLYLPIGSDEPTGGMLNIPWP